MFIPATRKAMMMDGVRDGEIGGVGGEDQGSGRPRAGGGGRGQRVVLLVEDNETDRDLYGGLLWYNGYEVVVAGDAEEALAQAESVRPDLVLLDIRLPGGVDGLEVAGRIRERGMTVPIVCLSAYSPDELEPRLQAAGIEAYLEKPVDPYAVVREVMRWIGPAGAWEHEGPGEEVAPEDVAEGT
jgi:two-component system, cell cycle response regulator DivK